MNSKIEVSRELLERLASKASCVRREALHGLRTLLAEVQEFDEGKTRADFERMAAVVYPGALSAGRHPIHGTYVNNNLEKRWKGWKACEEFRSGIVPVQQRGK